MRPNACQRLGAAKATATSALGPVVLALLLAAALASCGGGAGATKTSTSARAKHRARPAQLVAHIYAALPLRGPMALEGRAIRSGIALAKDNLRTRPGDLKIQFTVLNDSGRKSGEDNLKLAVTDAGRVATDPQAVYYIGDVGSAATAVTLPILNAAGIAQTTPSDPYVPTGESQSKLLRILPPYTAQAAADMLVFKQVPPTLKDLACTRVIAIAQDDPESTALVDSMYADAKGDGIQMSKPIQLASKADTLTGSQTTALEHQLPQPCGLVIAGSAAKPAVKLARTLHAMMAHAFIVGTSGLYNSKWTKGATRGISAVVDGLLWCTSPVLPLAMYQDGTPFIKLYETAHRHYPSPYAFYGYEAADLGIAMIDSLLADGDSRVGVREGCWIPGPELRS